VPGETEAAPTNNQQNSKMKTSIRIVGPREAEALLKNNNSNRALRDHHVAFLIQEMQAGRWKENGEAIIIGIDGQIKDGQHRLWAILETGLSFRFVIVEDVQPDVFSTIDCGLSRQAADSLSMYGVQNAAHVGSILQWCHKYYSGVLHHGRTQIRKSSPSQVLELLKLYPEAATPFESKLTHTLGAIGVLGATKVITSRIDKSASIKFFDRLVTGVGLSTEDPEYVLRERLISNRGDKAKLPQLYIFALAIKAWNYRGREIKTLKFVQAGKAKEEFPHAC
jgi:hypothetical protein